MQNASQLSRASLAHLAAALAAGVFAAAAPVAAPTGIPNVDRIFVALFAIGVVSLVVQTSPWAWLPAIAVCVAADDLIGIACATAAILAFLVALDRSAADDVAKIVRSVAGLALSHALLRIAPIGPRGASALAVGIVVLVLAGCAFAVARPRARRVAATGLTIAVMSAVVLSVGAAAETYALRFDVEVAADHGRSAADALADGDMEGATASLERAHSQLLEVQHDLRSGWTSIGRAVPILGQNLAALDQATLASLEVIDAGLVVAGGDDPRLLLRSGSIDQHQAEVLRMSMTSALVSIEDSRRHLEEIDTVWLAPPLKREVETLQTTIEGVGSSVQDSVDGLAILPLLTGADQPLTYLFIIGNPAEARDLGGFAAGYALVEAHDGAFSLIEAGRPGDLTLTPGSPTDLTSPYPQRFLELAPWKYGQNLTATGDLPTIARAASELFPSLRGVDVDGAVYLDPYALESLIAFSGPVEVAEYGIVLDDTNTADFFLTDQYEDFPVKRTRNRILEAFVSSFVDQFSALDSERVDAATARRLGQMVREQRLAIAVLDDHGAEKLDSIGISGAMPTIEPGQDYLAVSHINGGPNKLDAYLERSVAYRAEVDADTGALRATVEVTLTNTAPLGLSDYVTNNTHGYEPGTNRAILTIHTPHQEAVWSGPEPEPVLTRSFWEFARWRHERVVIVAPQSSVTVSLALDGTVSSGRSYELAIGHQPLVMNDALVVDVATGDGHRRFDGVLEHEIVLRD